MRNSQFSWSFLSIAADVSDDVKARLANSRDSVPKPIWFYNNKGMRMRKIQQVCSDFLW